MSDSIAFAGLSFRRRSDFIAGGSTRRPAIGSLNYTLGDTEGGGQSIIISGDNFTSVTSVAFGAAGNASYSVNNRTQITVTLPDMKFDALPSFDGVNDGLTNATAIGTLLPVGGYFYWVLFRANTITGTSGITTGYANNTIFVDTGEYIGPHFRLDSGTPKVSTYHWDTTGKGNEHTITIGKWHCLCARYDGVNIYSSIDGGAVSSVAAGEYDLGTGTLLIGKPNSLGLYGHVDIAEIGMIGSAQDDDLFTTIIASLNYDHNLNLGDVAPSAFLRETLACTLLLQEGNYTTVGTGLWSGTASAGSSGGRNATEATNYPTARTPGHEAIVDVTVTNNIGESDPFEFEYWDPTLDGTTRVVWDSLHTAYEESGNTWTPRYVKPRVNTTYTGLAESINNANATVTPAPVASNGAPTFTGDGTHYGLRTKTSALTWDEVAGVADASTQPGTIVLAQKYLDTSGAWSGGGPYQNDAFIGEHAGGTIGLGGDYDGATPVVAGHIWHPSLGYRAIKVEVPAHGDKMMVFSRFGANGSANFGVGVNGDTDVLSTTYSETIFGGGAYTSGIGSAYAGQAIDFGYEYDASANKANQTTKGTLYTAVVQDARASDATITKFYQWTQQRFGVGANDAAPTITSLNYSLGDTAGGGQSIVITGTNMGSVSSVKFDGTTATITAQTTTTCTVTLPAHAVGTIVVKVTNASGSASTSFEYWDPTEITGVDTYLDSNKGVTGTSPVTQWTDQVNGDNYTPGTGPTQTASVFGTMPAIRCTPTKSLSGAGIAAESTWSYFGVAKWTSSDTTASGTPYSVPLSLFGGSGWNGFGASAGTIAYIKHDTGIITRGSGLNDGNPHLIGATGDATPNIKLYAGETQQGATETPGGTNATYFDKVCGGVSGGDGWDGDIGALVVCTQVISAGDLTKLNNWSKQRFGTND